VFPAQIVAMKFDNGIYANLTLHRQPRNNVNLTTMKTTQKLEVKKQSDEKPVQTSENKSPDRASAVADTPDLPAKTECQEPAAVSENTGTQEQSPGVPQAEVNRLVAEAEARGYLRGRNESVAESLDTPRLWENPRRTEMERECASGLADEFLARLRPGVWD